MIRVTNLTLLCMCIEPVSYTHLDVYKRQILYRSILMEGRKRILEKFQLHAAVLLEICGTKIVKKSRRNFT